VFNPGFGSAARPAVKLALGSALLVVLMANGVANVPDGRDPTRPLRPSVSTAPAASAERVRPTLESVLIGAGRRVAVINGRRMSEGDVQQGVKVWEIRPDGVVVSVDGSPRMTLKIGNVRMHKESR
jgi:MSHA biogenesis protein MshK